MADDPYAADLARLVEVNGALNRIMNRTGIRADPELASKLMCTADQLRTARNTGIVDSALLSRIKTVEGRVAGKVARPTPSLIEHIVCDGYDYAMKVRWFGGSAAVIKAHLRWPGKRWRSWFLSDEGPNRWHWRFGLNFAEDEGAATALFNDLHSAEGDSSKDTFETFLGQFDHARLHANPTVFTAGLHATIYPLASNGVVIGGGYHGGVNTIIKEMRGVYLPLMRMWRVDATGIVLKNNLDTQLRLQQDQVVIEDVLYSIVNDSLVAESPVGEPIDVGKLAVREPSAEERAAEAAKNALYLAVTQPLAPFKYSKHALVAHLSRFELWAPFQPDGIRHLVGLNSALLADDMGLGKTVQAVVAADFITAKEGQTLVVCPATLIENWSREIVRLLPKDIVSKRDYAPEARWIVTNYESLGNMVQYADRFRVMITDEAHYLKEPTAQRTRFAFDIAAKIPHRYLLTGTPVLNREAEIYSLLRLSGHPIGELSLSDFLAQFSGNTEFRVTLNKRITEWMKRRMKDVLGLKGTRRQRFYLNPTEEQQETYDAMEADDSLGWIAKTHRLRRHLELIKLDYLTELVTDIRPTDKVIVYFEYKESIAELRRRLTAVGVGMAEVTGDIIDTKRRSKRQEQVDAFTEDPNVRVLAGTSAMAEGLNCQAGNYVAFGGLPWTPTKMRQIEGRADRGGQRRLVFVKIPMMEGSIDEDLWNILERKRKLVGDVVDAGTDAAHEVEIKAELAQRLAERAKKPRHIKRKKLAGGAA